MKYNKIFWYLTPENASKFFGWYWRKLTTFVYSKEPQTLVRSFSRESWSV